ncbi:hypothetical protein [Streptomyces sp. NPDC052610]|uniref:hypothetical protein n=1 Tax=Streptomyces sp. NPDC052610 TaxID=3154952 RepID=UPI003442AB87
MGEFRDIMGNRDFTFQESAETKELAIRGHSEVSLRMFVRSSPDPAGDITVTLNGLGTTKPPVTLAADSEFHMASWTGLRPGHYKATLRCTQPLNGRQKTGTYAFSTDALEVEADQ